MGLLVSIPPGPVGAMCIKRTINRGIRSGVVTGIGAASADTLYAIIAGLGVGYVINFIEQERYWIQLVGAAIILIIAIKLFYTNPAVEFRNNRTKKTNLFEEFVSVFFITLSNPLVVFIFIALFAGFNLLDGPNRYISALFLIGGVFSGAMLWWFSLSVLVDRFRNRIRLKNIWWLNRILGIIVFGCGVLALLKLYI
ncbi:MAG TPA: LysE family transporter [Bacteroidales bacterium]|nr:LysE family transporter [Bacteroidales bacterium]